MSQKHTKRKRPVQVPVVMQMEALECGAACLSMILAYFGRWESLEVVRRDCGVSRDGSKAKNILCAARNYGLEASGYRYEVEELKKSGSFPCILFWNFNHFVVLNGFYKNRAMINDPARGKITISMEEFDRSFTGVCLEFEPADGFQKGGKKPSVRKFILERMKGSASAILFTFLTTLIATLIGMIQPGFFKIFMDQILTGEKPSWITPFFVSLALFAMIQIGVSFASSKMSRQLGGKMDATGSASYLWKVLHLPMEFFSQRQTGDIYERQELNASIAGTLVNTISPLILQVLMLVFYLTILIHYSLMLSIIGVIAVLLNIAVAAGISRIRENLTRVQMRDNGNLVSATVSGFEMIDTIKASGAETGYFKRWSGYQASVNVQNVKMNQLGQILTLLMSIILTVSETLITVCGIWLIMSGQFTIGILTAFGRYLASFQNPVSSLILAGQSIHEMRTKMEQIEDVMNYPIEEERAEEGEAKPEEYRKLRGNLTMEHIDFGYSLLEPPLIRDFNLNLEAGKSVAFVGHSGCGKSTLSKLISGLYQPWKGTITIDGVELKDIDRSILTGSLAVVDQEITIFEDTIANNIKMWDESIEDFEMIMAARDAQIHEDIMLREDGYQHKLREGGREFSGGQRQRLEIARVLAQDPTIVLLDEATSALDAKTEANVVKAITDRGITCIVIAHRLSTIRDCDEIIVLDHGQVVERGTHTELYAQNGRYTELVTNE